MIGADLKTLRNSLGYTQQYVAQAASLSLATVQNIETGAMPNPRYATLQQIATVLGASITLLPPRANLELLCALGLPFASGKRIEVVRNGEILKRELLLATETHTFQKFELRIQEAIHALVIALHDHFPSTFKKISKNHPQFSKMVRKPRTGRLIKLRRIAVNYLAEYL